MPTDDFFIRGLLCIIVDDCNSSEGSSLVKFPGVVISHNMFATAKVNLRDEATHFVDYYVNI